MTTLYVATSTELAVNDKAIAILGENRIMAISTVRPDGWPQTTFVGYANDEASLYFVIFRASQKFANIAHDNRVSVAIGREPPDIRLAEALYVGATVSEVIDPAEREDGWRLLARRHPVLAGSPQPDWSQAALMRAECMHVSVLDYSQGLGHTDALHIASGKEER